MVWQSVALPRCRASRGRDLKVTSDPSDVLGKRLGKIGVGRTPPPSAQVRSGLLSRYCTLDGEVARMPKQEQS
jgi:hypothetical protein